MKRVFRAMFWKVLILWPLIPCVFWNPTCLVVRAVEPTERKSIISFGQSDWGSFSCWKSVVPSTFVRCCWLRHWLKNRWIHSVLLFHCAQIKGKTKPIIFNSCCQSPVAACQCHGSLVTVDKWKTGGIPLTHAFCLGGLCIFIGPEALLPSF